MVNVTDSAILKIKDLIAEENNPTTVKPVDTIDGVYNES